MDQYYFILDKDDNDLFSGYYNECINYLNIIFKENPTLKKEWEKCKKDNSRTTKQKKCPVDMYKAYPCGSYYEIGERELYQKDII